MKNSDGRKPYNVFDRIRSRYGSLSRQQKAIADFVLTCGLEVAFMSSNQIGEGSGTSAATVVRFAQMLGYESFVDLSEELHGLVLKGSRPMSQLEASLGTTDGSAPSIAKTVHHEIDSMARLDDLQQEAAAARAIELLSEARRIFVVGARSAYAVAYYAGFLLGELADNVRHFQAGTDDALEILERAGPEDVLLAVSFLRYARSSYRLVEFAADRGVRIVALTDGPASPIVPRAEVVLFAPSATPFHSYAAAMAVVDMVIWGFAWANRERFAGALEIRLQMLLEQKVFV